MHGLLDAGLLDELTLLTYPVVVGAGRRFFAAHERRTALDLVSADAFGNGVVRLVYAPRG